MADGKNYRLQTERGRITLIMEERSSDGKFHSASCDYPLYVYERDEQTEQFKLVRKSRRYTELYLLGMIARQLGQTEIEN